MPPRQFQRPGPSAGFGAGPEVTAQPMHRSVFSSYITRAVHTPFSDAPPAQQAQGFGHGHNSRFAGNNLGGNNAHGGVGTVGKIHPARVLRWSPHGDHIVTATDMIKVWNPERGGTKATILRATTSTVGGKVGGARLGGKPDDGKVGLVNEISWSPAKHAELASVGEDGVVRIWDITSGSLVSKKKMDGPIKGMAWADDGVHVTVVLKDGTMKKLSRHNMEPVVETQVSNPTSNLAFLPSSHELFVGSSDGTVHVLDSDSLEEVDSFHALASAVRAVTISPYSRFIAAGGADARISIWETTNMLCLRSLDMFDSPIRTISISFDDTVIVAGLDGVEQDIKFVSSDTGETMATVPVVGGAPAVEWHPRGWAVAYSSAVQSGFRLVGNPSG